MACGPQKYRTAAPSRDPSSLSILRAKLVPLHYSHTQPEAMVACSFTFIQCGVESWAHLHRVARSDGDYNVRPGGSVPCGTWEERVHKVSLALSWGKQLALLPCITSRKEAAALSLCFYSPLCAAPSGLQITLSPQPALEWLFPLLQIITIMSPR